MDSRTLQLTVNGDAESIDAPATVAKLIEKRRPRPPFAVELNRQLVRRDAYDTTALSDDDRVEIVTLVGGG